MQTLSTLVISVGLCAATLSAAVKIEEQVVGPAPDPALPAYKISPVGVHYAILTMKGSKSLVVVDGVEGPLIDELFAANGDPSLTAQTAVVFSRDGGHYAYLARAGSDYILVRDGKEAYRGKFWISALRYGTLEFSPAGKHLHFVAAEQGTNSSAVWRLVMDGKAGPDALQIQPPVFSADDSRWAYLARKIGARDDDWFAVVDGKDVGNIGMRPVFTSANRLLTTTGRTAGSVPQLLVDGKPVLKGTALGEKIWIAPKGGRYALAAQLKAGEPLALVVDGKPVAGGTDPQNVVFSPDGKHYMAACRVAATSTGFVITDGKAGQEYRAVAELKFTPDSSKAIYQASAGSKNFLIVNGEESPGFELLAGQVRGLVFSEQGGHYGYGTLDGMNRIFSAVVDGKSVLPAGRRVIGDSFSFSPDGKHYAFGTLPAARNDQGTMIYDGEEITGTGPQYFGRATTGLEPLAVFSPDSQQVVWRAGQPETGKSGLMVNRQFVPVFANYLIHPPTFSPDSRHLFWLTRESAPNVRPYYQLYFDGRKGPQFQESFEAYPNAWGIADDGALQFLALDGAVVKRYRVTADDETSVASMPAEAKKAEAEALAAAEKAKAEAEAAKANAQEAAYAAKAKAREEAIAAKKKAREDALAAKQKAREEAQANKRK